MDGFEKSSLVWPDWRVGELHMSNRGGKNSVEGSDVRLDRYLCWAGQLISLAYSPPPTPSYCIWKAFDQVCEQEPGSS